MNKLQMAGDGGQLFSMNKLGETRPANECFVGMRNAGYSLEFVFQGYKRQYFGRRFSENVGFGRINPLVADGQKKKV